MVRWICSNHLHVNLQVEAFQKSVNIVFIIIIIGLFLVFCYCFQFMPICIYYCATVSVMNKDEYICQSYDDKLCLE